jgi:hypothetical protein
MAIVALVLFGCSDNSSPVVSPTGQELSSPTTSTGLAKCGAKVVNSLSGSADNRYSLWYGPDGSLWGTIPDPKGKFYTVETFEADAYSDGRASGSFHYQFLGKLPPGLEDLGTLGRVEGKVIKLAVEGNRAFIVVEVTKSKGFPLPWWFAQVFIDNGKGAWSREEVSECFGKKASSRDEVSEWFITNAPSVDPGYGSRDLWLSMGPNDFIQWTKAQLAAFPDIPILFPIDHGNIRVR